MKLLFDQNLSYKLARAFSEEFPGSVHVRDVGLASADDLAVWEYAKRFGFTIISKDTDFSQRSFSSYLGVSVVRFCFFDHGDHVRSRRF